MEKEHLLQALHRDALDVARMARALGLDGPKINARIQRHGIERKKIPNTLIQVPVQP